MLEFCETMLRSDGSVGISRFGTLAPVCRIRREATWATALLGASLTFVEYYCSYYWSRQGKQFVVAGLHLLRVNTACGVDVRKSRIEVRRNTVKRAAKRRV